MKGHIHTTHTLECSHIVTCGCNHEIGDMSWCIPCQDFRIITESTTWVEPNTMINGRKELQRRAEELS